MRRQLRVLVGEPKSRTGTLHGYHEAGYRSACRNYRRKAKDYYRVKLRHLLKIYEFAGSQQAVCDFFALRLNINKAQFCRTGVPIGRKVFFEFSEFWKIMEVHYECGKETIHIRSNCNVHSFPGIFGICTGSEKQRISTGSNRAIGCFRGAESYSFEPIRKVRAW